LLNVSQQYRGRIAPSPTGYLHLGHAVTFSQARERARTAGGTLVLRIEDLDRERCRPEFTAAIEEDLRWFGIEWQEGPFFQSRRRELYLQAWRELRDGGFIYPCSCSRRDVAASSVAPHGEGDEPLYPGTCRGRRSDAAEPAGVNWRFRMPDGQQLQFRDGRLGIQTAVAGETFGDFLVWRRDDVPSYQLAVTVDDAEMQITEVVRGADLLISTFRQQLLYAALKTQQPQFYHTELITDENGRRLAKRDAAMSLRALRASGHSPEELRAKALAHASSPETPCSR
jgi:glutamyl/glutaminyl-tRNA synthetase